MPREAAHLSVLSRLMTAIKRRRMLVQAAYGAVLGAGVALPFSWPLRLVVMAFSSAGVLLWMRGTRTAAALAHAIERAHPACQNVVITAEELERHPERASEAVRERVRVHADHVASGIRAAEVVPIGRGVVAALAGVVLLCAPLPDRRAIGRTVDSIASAASSSASAAPAIRVIVDPPAYTRQQQIVLMDPQRIDVLEGSRIRFELPDGWQVRFGEASPAPELQARTSGYLAVESSGTGEVHRIVPLTVTADRAPVVRIENPGKDLLLPDSQRTIPVRITASDDLGIERLELRYTKVSGAGEQFEFVEGTLPITIHRSTDRDWTADARLVLPSLKLSPGDSLVYRAVARDARPGDAGIATSDTFFVEIAGPGQVPLEGIEMPPELERYAMSQQMIVLKLERLRAREPKMSREAVVEEAALLAAEQRTVRANFIFLLGGHVEDEFEEAEQSHEIQEGRLENRARRDINAAISYMTRAEQGLTAVDTEAALPPARAAVEALQRAFGRSRYLLRSLAVRSRLDPSRRLTGRLDDAGDWRRTLDAVPEREGEAARRLLNDLLALSSGLRDGSRPDPRHLARVAESAISIDPTSPVWSEVARALLDLDGDASLAPIIARVSQEAARGLVSPTTLANPASPLERAFILERRP